ncbi:MAG: LytR C-terminal domain-containing protein [Ilumatobacter sp.]|nr:LytR C-terminal domain-containing protein [Ilumatobacter sp.]
MSNDDITTGTGVTPGARRAPRQGVGGSPVGSTLSIVLALVAVVAGFLILRDLTSEDSTAGGAPTGQNLPDEQNTTTTFDAALPTTIPPTTTTTIVLVTEGATVVVANGNTIGGSAGRMSETLGDAGFQMGSPTNAASTVDDSVVYYDPTNTAAKAVADSVAFVLGGVAVEAVTTPAPTENGSLGDAGVLVVLGNNQADKSLEQLAAEGGLSTPPTGTSPPVAGGDVVAPTTQPPTTDG